MTAKEAYDILCKKYGQLQQVIGCLDYGNFYIFSLAPMDVTVDGTYYTGTQFDAVDKKTGRTFVYDITSDLDAYERAKPVEVETVYDMKL